MQILSSCSSDDNTANQNIIIGEWQQIRTIEIDNIGKSISPRINKTKLQNALKKSKQSEFDVIETKDDDIEQHLDTTDIADSFPNEDFKINKQISSKNITHHIYFFIFNHDQNGIKYNQDYTLCLHLL